MVIMLLNKLCIRGTLAFLLGSRPYRMSLSTSLRYSGEVVPVPD